MKKLLPLLSLLLVLVLAFTNANEVETTVTSEITNWKNDKKASIVFTFDDWSPGHGSIVYPLFKKNNVPCTFYITLKNKDYSGGYATMKKAFNDGFEIGNHTATHADLSTLDSADLVKELTAVQEVLRKEVHPKCANTLAYPYGVFDGDVLKLTKQSHMGARLATLRYGRS